MADSYVNIAGMSVSGTPGTGTITLASALSGHTALDASHDGQSFSVTYIDGTACGVEEGCVYTHSGTTLARGTHVRSTTGSQLSLTSAAEVHIIASAGLFTLAAQASLETVSGSDAATTMEVGKLYVTDMSAWATADRTYTLPATAAVGDRCGVVVSSGNASYELLMTAASGDTIEGVAGGTEWSRVFLTGEVVIFRCVVANSAWVVEIDGRISCLMTITGSYTHTSTSAGQIIDLAGESAETDNAGMLDTANDQFVIRRAGQYLTAIQGQISASASGKTVAFQPGAGSSSPGFFPFSKGHSSVAGTVVANGLKVTNRAVGDVLLISAQQSDSTSEDITWTLTMREVL